MGRCIVQRYAERLDSSSVMTMSSDTTAALHNRCSSDDAQAHTPPVLAYEPNILATFAEAVQACGVVGELRSAKVIFLAVVSRLLQQPVSLAMKGLSGSGKSFMTETTLKFFPKTQYISMTAMSERALIYMKEDFKHRTLVIYEAVALQEQRETRESNLTAYFVRSLLSEGRIAYPVTVRDKDSGGFITKTIVKEGPTNIILTTTATELHVENETRLLSLPTDDSQEQTRAVMKRLAEGPAPNPDFTEWHALQIWLASAERRVSIPYAVYLAEHIPPVAVRLRRDFKTLLRLIEAHAILHQCTRARDSQGCIVANKADYLAVRDLIADLLGSGVGATVPHTMRATVKAVEEAGHNANGVSLKQIAERLRLDRSAAQRRVKAARERGYLVNLEQKPGEPGRYVIGDPLPEEVSLLPHDVPDTPRDPAPQSASHDSPDATVGIRRGVQLCSNSGGDSEDFAEEVIDLAD